MGWHHPNYPADEKLITNEILEHIKHVLSMLLLVVSNVENTVKDIIANASSILNDDVPINFAVAPVLLSEYNTTAGTIYEHLPSNYYTLSENTSVNKTGSNSSLPIKLLIDPIPENAPDLKIETEYAIAITITDVSGNIPLLDASKTVILFLQSDTYNKVDPYNTRPDGNLISGVMGGWSKETNKTSKLDFPTSALIDGNNKNGTLSHFSTFRFSSDLYIR